ncbi:DUF1450 domain-containing protein [Tumebacillus flagellatus]|uniref:UDP-N-acetylmuramoylalanine--D-glutamate ligase n=1 Tax=Tumebacillus flagellatus TaxID=1157490 RepID=A0A074LQ46_9BACL|nr:DUF1450 domain-containing protein [Tumebacillus flagellatus]KEO83209.1 hypothetical protein EL26_10980 [Tumebacillus flagellatus]
MGESKRVTLDFCNGNLMSFTQELFLSLREEHPEWNISKYGCLTNCGECAVRPFAILNDDIVAAETPEELRTKLLERIEQL